MPELTRRRAIVFGAAGAAVAAVGATTTAVAAAPDTTAGPAARDRAAAPAGHHHGGPQPFDEVYKGRRIQGMAGGGHHHGAGYAVFVDGVELHTMRNADGSWISVVSHYEPVTTPRAAARAAVDELQGAALLPFPAN
ncbi:tyrosinase cofactor [Streptomyces sp. NPDC005017]|uniref:apotyrosinase chaperone MelC1 n=1 Tax=Streptomyces sp. NPDC005017 TaxID=3364706 RepID=UPI00368A8A37